MNRTTDWYDVEPFGEWDYRLLEAPRTLPCNLYLLRGSDDALLVDSGTGVGDLRATVEELIETDVQLLLTHTHWDHIGAGHQFDRALVHPRERGEDGRVTIDSLSDEFGKRPGQFVEGHLDAGESFPDGFDAENFAIPPIPEVETISEAGTIDLGDRAFELVHVPGHAPGQLGVLDREAGVFHGSDVVHVEHNVYVHFEDSDLDAYVDTLERLVDLRDDGAFDVLTTAHNPPISGGDLSVLEDLHGGLEAIAAGEYEPEVVDTPWGPAHKYEIGDTDVLTKTTV